MADIWSLGILLYTLLCGAFPFKANSEKELYSKITKGVFSCPEHLSPSVCDLIRRILLVGPSDRPNAEEVIKILFIFTLQNTNLFLYLDSI